MIEVLWHGRGGQGAFTAARLLGAASSFADGSYALAFPSFGPERRGAPMRAFTKMSREPIGDRSAVNRANYVIYLDDTLLGEGWEDELLPDGKVIVNSVRSFGDPRIVAIDANGISQEILGRPIPNTALLGALCSVCDYVSADDVKRAIEGYMPAKLHEKNKRVVDAALEAVGKTRAAGVAVKIDESLEPQTNGLVSRETGQGCAFRCARFPWRDGHTYAANRRARSRRLRPYDMLRRRLPRSEERRLAQYASGARCREMHGLSAVLPVLSRWLHLPSCAADSRCGGHGSRGYRLRFLQGVRRVRRGVPLRCACHGPRKRG